ncbi:hypothetical protein KM043_001809 [Ampulex compressa]|nr:hypothetical protein KM043_001809 [Ampulex compressa]
MRTWDFTVRVSPPPPPPPPPTTTTTTTTTTLPSAATFPELAIRRSEPSSRAHSRIGADPSASTAMCLECTHSPYISSSPLSALGRPAPTSHEPRGKVASSGKEFKGTRRDGRPGDRYEQSTDGNGHMVSGPPAAPLCPADRPEIRRSGRPTRAEERGSRVRPEPAGPSREATFFSFFFTTDGGRVGGAMLQER